MHILKSIEEKYMYAKPIKVLVRNILLKNGFNAKNSNEEMCCEMFLTYIDNLSLEIENKNKKPLGR